MATATEEQPCRLLTLPPELRNRIWRYALPQGLIIWPTRGMERIDEHSALVRRIHEGDQTLRERAQSPSMLQVNRQIRHEARPIYVAASTFAFVFDLEGLDQWSQWCAELRAEARHIRRLKLFVRDDYSKDEECDDCRTGDQTLCQFEIILEGVGSSTSVNVKGDVDSGCPLTFTEREEVAEERAARLKGLLMAGISTSPEDEADAALCAALGQVVTDFMERIIPGSADDSEAEEDFDSEQEADSE